MNSLPEWKRLEQKSFKIVSIVKKLSEERPHEVIDELLESCTENLVLISNKTVYTAENVEPSYEELLAIRDIEEHFDSLLEWLEEHK